MPIVLCAEHQPAPPEAFCHKLKGEGEAPAQQASAMLALTAKVNEVFAETPIYAFASHGALLLKPTNSGSSGWYVGIFSVGGEAYEVEYRMPDLLSPWKNATVCGKAATANEAFDYLILAMVESKGWEDSKELRKLHSKLRKRNVASPQFTLWLEFEEVEPGSWSADNEFCNVVVNVDDGRRYGLNVWTYKFLDTVVGELKNTGECLNGLYVVPPDLFVKELTRDCIEQVIRDLLKAGDLDKVLNPSVCSIKYNGNRW